VLFAAGGRFAFLSPQALNSAAARPIANTAGRRFFRIFIGRWRRRSSRNPAQATFKPGASERKGNTKAGELSMRMCHVDETRPVGNTAMHKTQARLQTVPMVSNGHHPVISRTYNPVPLTIPVAALHLPLDIPWYPADWLVSQAACAGIDGSNERLGKTGMADAFHTNKFIELQHRTAGCASVGFDRNRLQSPK